MTPADFTRPDVVRLLADRSDVSTEELIRQLNRSDLPVEAREAAGRAVAVRDRRAA